MSTQPTPQTPKEDRTASIKVETITPKVESTKTVVTEIEESLGARATKLANIKATQWLEDTWSVITRRVLDTAQRGLFRCAIRFEDVIPQDAENQSRLLKLIEKQNLKGTWKPINEGAGVQLDIQWGQGFL